MSNFAVRTSFHSPWPTACQADLLQAVLGPRRNAMAAYRRWRDGTDLDGVIDFATYRLLPLLDRRFNEIGAADDFSGRCRGVYRRAWFENNLLFAEVADVLRQLHAAGVATMLLKGAPLALDYYPGHGLRPMSDIDFLVREADADRATGIIAALPGWRRQQSGEPDIERRYGHSITFDGERMQLDLHWHCLRESRGRAGDAWFWDRAVSLDFRGVRTLQPDATALLLSIIIHGLRCNGVPPVRWIADAVHVLRRDPAAIDWDGLVRFARGQRLTRRLGAGLDYLRGAFDVPIPAEVPAALLGTRAGVVERIENRLYLADPAAYRTTLRQRGWRLFANYVVLTGARSLPALAGKLLFATPHFLRFRRDMKLAVRRRRQLASL